MDSRDSTSDDQTAFDEHDEANLGSQAADNAQSESQAQLPGKALLPANKANLGCENAAAQQDKPGNALAKQLSVYVDWASEQDPQNPFNFTNATKWRITILASCFCFMAGFSGSSFAIGIQDMESDLHNLHELSLLGISLYPFGFGVTPLFTAPLSEAYGRRSLFVATGFLLAAITIPIGASHTITGVLICRFLAGCFASTGSTLAAGVISDIWETKDRGPPMAIFTTATFTATGCGPFLMGFVVYWVDWRWVQYVQAIACGILFVIAVVALPETRGSTLLSWKAKRMRKETGDERFVARADVERASLLILIKTSLSRPLWYLVSEPVVIALSIWISFVWAVLWGFLGCLTLDTSNSVFRVAYDFNIWQQGMVYLSLVIGTLIAVFVNRIQEKLYAKNVQRKGPEARLYFAMAGGLLCAGGVMLFCWTQGRVHWIVPLIGLCIYSIGIFGIYNAIFCYLADAYLVYASSAIAAQSFARNMLGSTFPLFIQQMYTNMGYTWASFLIAMIAFVLAVIPFVLYAKGETIRSRSKVVQELARMDKNKQDRKALMEKEKEEKATLSSG